MFNDITFEYPTFLFLLLGLIPMIIWYVVKQYQQSASLTMSNLAFGEALPSTYKIWLRHFPFLLRLLSLGMLIFVIARPQAMNRWQDVTTEGIDIVMSLDVSTSMLARDFKPDRLEAAKDLATEFILGRHNDRIGLVIFAGESFTQSPITTDHPVVVNLFKDIKTGVIEDGTAIGMGLATSVKRLKDSDAKSKVVILLTDGENNKGDVDPITAAEIAKTFGVRVYTIGVGSKGTAPYPVETMFGTQIQNIPVNIDEDILKEIAQITGGQYYRATNNAKLREIYAEIDQLEKTKVDVKQYSKKDELYFMFALIGLIALLTEIILKNTLLRSIP